MRTATALFLSSLLLAACDAGPTGGGGSSGAEGTDAVRSLHRGELSAVSTYEAALQKNDSHAWAPALRTMLDEHRDAAKLLSSRVTALGGKPDTTAGLWGGWADLVAKTAATLGDEPARDALKTGESHGVKEYERALEDKNVDATTKALIRDRLLDRARSHVTTLDSLKK